MDHVLMSGGDLRTGQANSFTDGYGVWTSSNSEAIDFNSFLPPPNTNINGVNSALDLCAASENDLDQPLNHVDAIQCPTSVSTQNLTSLLQDADKVWARLPLQSTSHMPQSQSDELFQKLVSEKVATKSLLEAFFHLAQRLVDTYPAALDAAMAPTESQREPASPCDIADCTHTFELDPPLSELEAQVSGQGLFSGPDLALANLVVACHTRLLDILDRVFLLVASCTRVTLACRREPCFDVSELRVGAFVPQRTAAVLMQLALLRHMMARLAGQLAAFGRAVAAAAACWAGASAAGAARPPEAVVLELQHEILARRHAQKAAQVGVVEEFLSTFDPPKA